MHTRFLEHNQQRILENEQDLARQLAHRVLDKPVPPIWMILIPIFFVFHAWKIKAYARGLEDFAEHYLLPRRQALEAAADAVRAGTDVDLEALLSQAETLPVQGKPLYGQWMVLLTEHYRTLLTARGDGHPALVRSGYQSKTNYLLFCNRLNQAENAFNLALLPQIEADNEDLLEVIRKMERAITELRRQESDLIFG